MNTENMAKEFEAIVERESKLKPPSGTGPITRNNGFGTVTADIEALKSKLDVILKGIQMLKEQL